MKSLKITPISFHRLSRLYSRRSFPSSRICPSVGSYRRVSNLTIVVLPWPFSPTIAMRSEGPSLKLTFLSTILGFPGYLNETFLNSNPEQIGVVESRAETLDPLFGFTQK